MADNTAVYTGTGRRKEAVARVRLVPGTGKVTVNGRDALNYFGRQQLVDDACAPSSRRPATSPAIPARSSARSTASRRPASARSSRSARLRSQTTLPLHLLEPVSAGWRVLCCRGFLCGGVPMLQKPYARGLFRHPSAEPCPAVLVRVPFAAPNLPSGIPHSNQE